MPVLIRWIENISRCSRKRILSKVSKQIKMDILIKKAYYFVYIALN